MFKTRVLTTCLIALSIGCYCSSAMGISSDFEDLTSGAAYGNRDSFTTGELTIDVISHRDFAKVYVHAAPTSALGSTELWIEDVLLDFNVPEATNEITMDFGIFSGLTIIAINGETKSFFPPDFFNGATVGGVACSASNVTEVLGGYTGTLTMSGAIDTFTVSAQEMAVDNVMIATPEPASLSLVALGGLAMIRRKRQ